MWRPAAQMEKARQDLFSMKEIGVDAVRTPWLNNDALYALADSLDLVLYQDLPVQQLSATQLNHAISSTKAILDQALLQASQYTSIRYFGLSYLSDTSDEEACNYIEEIIRFSRVRYGSSNRFYYTTPFIEKDKCASSVDLVLIDTRDDSDLLSKQERWRSAHPNVPMGFASIGTWVIESLNIDEPAPYGYKRTNSQEYQARYLENALTSLLDQEKQTAPEVIFVYRWRDMRTSFPSPAHNLSQPFKHTYGLISSGNTHRTSFEVVEGIYSGKKRVFALQAGTSAPEKTQWIVLLMWANVFVLSYCLCLLPKIPTHGKTLFYSTWFF